MSFEILTDAGANLIGNAVSDYRVTSVPFACFADGAKLPVFNTANERQLSQVSNTLKNSADAATGYASEESFENLFVPILDAGRDVLYIGISGALSQSYYAALNVANRLRESYPHRKICCFDSLSASMGQGMLVAYACQQKERGRSVLAVYDDLEEQVRRVRHLVVLDSPAKLLHEGKLSKLNYNPDTAFGVCPVLSLDENGQLKQVARAHGKSRAIGEMSDRVAAEIDNPSVQTVYIAHTNCGELAWSLRERLTDKIDAKRIVVDFADPSFAAHTGNAVGVFYYAEKR